VTAAYVDSSIVAAIVFGESGAKQLARRLQSCQQLFSSQLLEAEVRSAARRERRPVDEGWFAGLTWVMPSRSLSAELTRVLETGYLRGADCWHLACALYLAPEPSELPFLTLDSRQRSAAAALGFRR
jgi:predicted nucleic acid-binding protein